MAPSRYDWKIVDWDVKPQYNQPTKPGTGVFNTYFKDFYVYVFNTEKFP